MSSRSPAPVTAIESQVVDQEEGAGDLSEDSVVSLPAVEETTAESVASPVSTPGGEPQLVMEFADDCWVDIRDASGERLAYGLMKANTTHSVSGNAPFSLVLGNAGAVNIKINGQPVDKSTYVPARGTVAKFSLDVPADQVN
jgi:cytoskeleton protein RodZ